MFDAQFPHKIKIGSEIHPHIHWSPNSAVIGNVGWGIEYTEANINEAFPVTTTDLQAFATDGTQYKHQLSAWNPIVKEDRNISAMFKCRVFRSDTGGIDTYADVVWLHEFDIHYEIDTMGSRFLFIK